MKHISAEKTWFEPTEAISGLDGREIRIRFRDGSEATPVFSVETADPSSQDAGKCCVALCYFVPGFRVDEENPEPTIQPGPYKEYVTQDGLGLFLPFVQTHHEDALFEVPSDWEPSDR